MAETKGASAAVANVAPTLRQAGSTRPLLTPVDGEEVPLESDQALLITRGQRNRIENRTRAHQDPEKRERQRGRRERAGPG
ncbi:hypothetical protein [Streptomyces sp. CNZ287]|uniref:hypothetical protein n=1 Tax=Streptomyces sp. B22F1 TaxID=3153566 RepID=UPI00119993FA